MQQSFSGLRLEARLLKIVLEAKTCAGQPCAPAARMRETVLTLDRSASHRDKIRAALGAC